VVKGSIKFDFPTRHKTVNLTAGDRLELPTGIRHSAVVGLEGVDCLEAHIY
jgi:cupin superfamily acireductone dioxygenase involved in methionine salvage